MNYQQKFCTDCVLHERDVSGEDVCTKKPLYTNLVDGHTVYPSCETERDASWLSSLLIGTCGSSGRFFFRKEKP